MTRSPLSRLLPLLFTLCTLSALSAGTVPLVAQSATSGRLVIIGGGGLGGQPDIYRAILDGRHGGAPVCVIPTASATPDASLESAVRAFTTHGGEGAALGIARLTVDTPESARDPEVVAALGRCGGYYFVGGVQSRIVEVFRPAGVSTPAFETVMRRFREGAVVSGSSAGAAIMSHPMIAGGASGAMAGGVQRTSGQASDDQTATAPNGLALVSIEPGLGFFPPALVDQHFLARGRIGRLLVAVLDMPEFDLGFGIDESTALVVDGTTVWPVGASGIVVVDGAAARTEGASSTGVRLHLMSGGDRFDLSTRTLIPAPAKTARTPGSPVEAPENLFSPWTFFHLLDDLAVSSQSELAVPVPSGRIVLRKLPDFQTRGLSGEGVQGTTAGLTVTGLAVDLHRQPD